VGILARYGPANPTLNFHMQAKTVCFLRLIPDLPTAEVVQQKLEEKVSCIAMKDPVAVKSLQEVLLARSRGFLSKGSPMSSSVEADTRDRYGDAKPFKEVFRVSPRTQQGHACPRGSVDA
jgi:hypothetical protein